MRHEMNERVEARTDAGEPWRRAVVTSTDRDDTTLPYFVQFDDGDGTWVRGTDIRPVPAPRLQYRTVARNTSRPGFPNVYSEWRPLGAGANLSVAGAYAVETREQPARTDAEIVAKLREYTNQQSQVSGAAVDEKFAEILGGSF